MTQAPTTATCREIATCRARYGALWRRFEMESGGSAAANAAKDGWQLMQF
jgi:hypothetical protein